MVGWPAGRFPLPADPAAIPDAFHVLIRRADRTRGPRARVVIALCVDHLPHYRGLPDSMMAEIGESIRRHLALFYRVTLEEGRPLCDADLAYSREIARLRARQGVPLGEFLTFFHVGLRVAWEDLMERVGDDPALRAGLLARVAAVIFNQQELMTALTEAYVQERERLSRFREQDVDDFFRLLLAEDTLPGVLEARLAALGIELVDPHAVAVLAPPAADGHGPGVAPGDVRRRLEELDPGADVWVGRWREGFAALVPEATHPKHLGATAESLLGPEARVGVGGAGVGLAAVRRSAWEALRTLRLGAKLRGRRVLRYADVAVTDLVGVGSPSAEHFMRGVLGPLADAGASATQLETLRQLAQHGYRAKLAAAALDIHPHTLSYRVKQLRRRFGLDLDDPEVRLRVQLALRILDARGGDGEG